MAFLFSKGFTLVEIIISMGLLACIAAVGMPVSISFYNAYIFHSEYINAIRLVEQARSKALSQKDGNYGVRFSDHKLTVFTPNESIEFPQNSLSHIGTTSEIIFSSTPNLATQSVIVTDGKTNKNIFVNEVGRIESD